MPTFRPTSAPSRAKKGVPLSELTNDLLRKEIAILETVGADQP
jgi:hypothetical protein